MDSEIELISDGEGLAVIGDAASVEHFLASEGLTPTERDWPRLGLTLMTLAGVAQAGSMVAAKSGRWVQLTKESASDVNRIGLMATDTPGVKPEGGD